MAKPRTRRTFGETLERLAWVARQKAEETMKKSRIFVGDDRMESCLLADTRQNDEWAGKIPILGYWDLNASCEAHEGEEYGVDCPCRG